MPDIEECPDNEIAALLCSHKRLTTVTIAMQEPNDLRLSVEAQIKCADCGLPYHVYGVRSTGGAAGWQLMFAPGETGPVAKER